MEYLAIGGLAIVGHYLSSCKNRQHDYKLEDQTPPVDRYPFKSDATKYKQQQQQQSPIVQQGHAPVIEAAGSPWGVKPLGMEFDPHSDTYEYVGDSSEHSFTMPGNFGKNMMVILKAFQRKHMIYT